MALDVKIQVTRVAASTSGGTQNITISGFGTPKAAMFIISTATSDGLSTNSGDICSLGVGFTDGTNDRLGVFWDTDNVSASSSSRARHDTNECGGVFEPATSGNEDFFSFSSWVTDGVQISWTSTPVRAYLITTILFGGSDLSVAVGDVDQDSSVSTLSFAPDTVIFVNPNSSSSQNSNISDTKMSYGFSFKGASTEEGCYSHNFVDTTTPSSVSTAVRNDGAFSQGGSYVNGITTWASNGFTVGTGVGSDRIAYLALKTGLLADVRIIDGPTSTGNQSYTGVGFKPQFLMVIGSDHDTVNTIETTGTGSGFSVAVYDGTNENSYATIFGEEDAANPTNVWYGAGQTIISAYNDTGSSAVNIATVSSLDSDGYTFNYSTANATARKHLVFAISDTYNLQPGQGTLTLSGSAPAVTESANKSFEPGQASLSLSTTAPDVAFSRDITPSQADLTLSGSAPTVSFPREITVPQADLTLSFSAPTLAAPHDFAMPQGRLLFESDAPQIMVGSSSAITVIRGNIAFSSTAPTVSAGGNAIIEVPQGNLTLQSLNYPSEFNHVPLVFGGQATRGGTLRKIKKLRTLDSGQEFWLTDEEWEYLKLELEKQRLEEMERNKPDPLGRLRKFNGPGDKADEGYRPQKLDPPKFYPPKLGSLR